MVLTPWKRSVGDPAEQLAKDNFELRSKPGAYLVVLGSDGNWEVDRELVDPAEPHSTYQLDSGNVYSIHDDGTDRLLDTLDAPRTDKFFGRFAEIAFNKDRWLKHLKTLAVFHFQDQVYHDVQGNAQLDVNVRSVLMGKALVESTGPLAEREGKFYYQVICYENNDFENYVFVEDSVHQKYALVPLMASDRKVGVAGDHAVFVDEKGNVFEGVVKKDGYHIYEWKIVR